MKSKHPCKSTPDLIWAARRAELARRNGADVADVLPPLPAPRPPPPRRPPTPALERLDLPERYASQIPEGADWRGRTRALMALDLVRLDDELVIALAVVLASAMRVRGL